MCLCLAGETNGKSNNLNNALTNHIYKDYYPVNPNGPKIPKYEVAVVFDAGKLKCRRTQHSLYLAAVLIWRTLYPLHCCSRHTASSKGFAHYAA